MQHYYVAETVYILCGLTSLVVAALLLRGYRRSGVRLLLWSGLCFVFLSLNNVLLFVDKVIVGPERDLSLWRSGAAVIGLMLLLYGLIWESEWHRSLPMEHLLINKFLFGVIVMACLVTGLFFLKFWRKTRDRLFVIFGIAFWTLGVNWLALAFTQRNEVQTALYVVRFLAYVLILVGIIDKNRAGRTSG